MHHNLDLSIQKHEISHNGRRQKLDFENYFLIHRWKPTDIMFSFYSEKDLKRLHRVFGHPSVQALHNLLKRADPDSFSQSTEVQLVMKGYPVVFFSEFVSLVSPVHLSF